MVKLILMRHAKSSWAGPNEPDHARPLNARGRRNAVLMGDWLRKQAHLPEQVICSTAQRTRETFAYLGLDAPIQYKQDLYHAEPPTLWDQLALATKPTVLLIGHNPGFAEFASQAARVVPRHPRFHDYPTCATTVFSFPSDNWHEARPGAGDVLDFAIPRELSAQEPTS